MELTKGQNNALQIAIDRYNHGEKYTTIIGPAGTGKTSVIRPIIEALKINEADVVFCAYTGKACKVLQNKGNKNVSTLHKLMYHCYPDANGKYIFKPKTKLEYSFIVVDECSMVGDDMVNMLLGFPNIYVIFLGDDAQLPPVKANRNWLFKDPHAKLDEILRQEEDSEIIKYSKDIREGKILPQEYDGNEVKIFQPSDFSTVLLEWADIVLCATNSMRHALNRQMRELKGYSGSPKVGEKIICTHNDWNTLDSNGNPLVNGTIGYIDRIIEKEFKVPKYVNVPNNKVSYYQIDFTTEDGAYFNNICVDKGLLENGVPTLNPKQIMQIFGNRRYRGSKPSNYQSFEYGYSISVWKSQGSEWDKVLLVEENFPYDQKEHREYMYTGVTRSASKLVVVRK